MTKNNPAVSIVIPMYNAEKYIGECLESILQQSFQDFEVILVDDCSTDKSRVVAENYIKKFANKFKLISTEKNSGNPATPQNLGIKNARGKYLFLLDNDDAITKTAVEELYNLAEKFQADVVHCENFFQADTEENLLGRNDYKVFSYKANKVVFEPTFLDENIFNKLIALQERQFLWNLWTKFIRRDFWLENKIELLNVAGQDMICTICLVLSAKKFLRVPNVVNIYRNINSSLSHKQETFFVELQKWTSSLFGGIAYLDKFLDDKEFFKNNSDAKYLAFDTLAADIIGCYLLEIYEKISAPQLDNLIRTEFEKIENKSAVAAFIFSKMNVQQLNLIKQHQIIKQLRDK